MELLPIRRGQIGPLVDELLRHQSRVPPSQTPQPAPGQTTGRDDLVSLHYPETGVSVTTMIWLRPMPSRQQKAAGEPDAGKPPVRFDEGGGGVCLLRQGRPSSTLSVSAITNASGVVRERYTYDAYGKMYVRDASGALKSSQVPMQPYGFTGRRYDEESGLWYFRARYYDDQLGRFISRDPLGYVDGMSLYGGYFVPIFLDWLGTFSTDRGVLTNELGAIICSNLHTATASFANAKGATEWGWQFWEDPQGALVSGSVVQGPADGRSVDPSLSNAPPNNTNKPVGSAHSHPSGTASNIMDLDWGRRQRANNAAFRLEVVVGMGEPCCNGDPALYGVWVEVFIWENKAAAEWGKRETERELTRNMSKAIPAFQGHTAKNEYDRCMALEGATHKDCTRKANAAGAKALITAKLLSDYFTFTVCCDINSGAVSTPAPGAGSSGASGTSGTSPSASSGTSTTTGQ